MITGGVLANLSGIGVALNWIKYVNPISYGISGLWYNELSNG